MIIHMCDRCKHVGKPGEDFDVVQWADGWGHLCHECVQLLHKTLGDFMNNENPLSKVDANAPDRIPDEWLR